jgi:tetratricopeptide (TPR) repeat protein
MNTPPDDPKDTGTSTRFASRDALPRPTMRHKLILGLIGVILGCLILLALEIGLRLARYGPDLRVFQPIVLLGEKYWEFNRDISQRYFPKGMTKTPGFVRFPAAKSPGTYRVFSLGESTTQGDPYGPQASYSAFLQEMLQDLHPDRKIEVVNCGIVAISSADILDILPDVLRQKPDAVLLYFGHNEAYGADGVLSAFHGTLTNRQWMKLRIKLRNTRTGMLVLSLLQKVHPARPGSAPGFGMEAMEGKVLPHQSKLHHSMLEIYRGNLQEMVDRCRKAGADVILCTECANGRDQSPMGSAHGPSFRTEDLKKWQDLMTSARTAMDASHPNEAIAPLQRAAQIDSSYAETRFRLARCLDPLLNPGATDTAAARRQYQAALDEDIVHFRACSDENRVVREVASRNQGPHLLLVDLDRDLAAISPDGIAGCEFMNEHVHPYTEGNEFLARRICRAMAANPVGSSLGAWDFTRLKAPEEYLARLGLTEIDEAVGLFVTAHKLSKWPFTSAYENSQAASRLEERFSDLTKNLDPIEAQVLAEIQAGRLDPGMDYGHRHEITARRAMAARRAALAAQEFQRCDRYWGPTPEIVSNLAQARLLANDLGPVDSLLDLALKLDPKMVKVRFLRGMLRRAQGRIPEARTEFEAYVAAEPTTSSARAARQFLMEMGR